MLCSSAGTAEFATIDCHTPIWFRLTKRPGKHRTIVEAFRRLGPGPSNAMHCNARRRPSRLFVCKSGSRLNTRGKTSIGLMPQSRCLPVRRICLTTHSLHVMPLNVLYPSRIVISCLSIFYSQQLLHRCSFDAAAELLLNHDHSLNETP